MVERQRLATTRRDAFQPLLSGGRPTIEAWAQLHAFLGEALGQAHAALLAEPRRDSVERTDWYAGAGAVRPIDAAGRRRIKALAGDIHRLADNLDRAGDENRRSLGRLLRQALRVPADAPAFCVGAQPVLVAWGHIDAVSTSRRKGSLVAATAAVIAVLALGGVAGWWLWHHLPRPALRAAADPVELAAVVALHAEQDRTAALRQRLDELRLQTAMLRLQCPPPAAPAAPKPPISTFGSEVKPSMPAAPKRPVEVAPLPPPARR